MWFKGIPVCRQGLVAGSVDTHSYCSGHMLMRVTGLQEKRREGGRERGRGVRYHKTFQGQSHSAVQNKNKVQEESTSPNAEWLSE